MNVIPTGNRILVKPLEESNQTKGGIIIPNPIEKPVKYAEALKIGPKATDVSIGDTVVFSKYAGVEADDGCLIVKEEDILALIKKTENNH